MKIHLFPITAKARQRCGSKHAVEAEVLRTASVACFGGQPGHRVRLANGHERWVRCLGDEHFNLIA